MIANIKLTDKVIRFLVVIKVKINPAERFISKEANDFIITNLFIFINSNIYSKNSQSFITYKNNLTDYWKAINLSIYRYNCVGVTVA